MNIVLIGDSIRMGYQETVIAELSGEADVWGPEQNGGTSENVRAHLDEWVISRDCDIVHINCGLHDLKKPFDSSENNIPVSDYTDNLNAIFSRVQQHTDAEAVFALTTPVNEKLHHENKSFDRFESDVDAYNRAACEVASGFGIECNDLNSVVDEYGRDKILREDGVHFFEEGYRVLGKAVADFLRTMM